MTTVETVEPPRAVPAAKFSGKSAAVLLYSFYPADPRPKRTAEALIDEGMSVDLLCLKEFETEADEEVVNGVRVFRLSLTKASGGKISYFIQYAQFLIKAFLFLLRRGWKGQYDLVHVHNMPDILVFSALIPKTRGAQVILDLHDPMPELMTSIYGLDANHWLVKTLLVLERWSIAFADLAVTPNIAFKRLFCSRSCAEEKMGIVINTPEPHVFDPDQFATELPSPGNGRPYRLMHHGSILHRHGIDILVEAVAKVRPQIPEIQLDILGTRTPFLDDVLFRAKELKVDDCVHYLGARTQTEIAQCICDYDLGVVPNRRNPFTEINFPTRLFEYVSLRRPVIAPNTEGIRDYFGKDDILYFEPDDAQDLADKILWAHRNHSKVVEIVENGREVYRRNLWRDERDRFVLMVVRLLSHKQQAMRAN